MIAAVAGGWLFSIGAVFTAMMTVMVARVVVVPARGRPEAIRISRVDTEHQTVTLNSCPDTRLPGRYSLWFALDSGHLKVGEIVAETQETVTRRLLAVDHGDLGDASRGRFSGWFYLGPQELGYPFESVVVPTALGDAPAWVIPTVQPSDRWVVLVHGRGVKRAETLRAVRVFRDSGFNALVASWRNDGDAPASSDNRYGLGGTEWLDIDAAMRFLADRGATEIVLMGWSMGAANVLQAQSRSELSHLVAGIVLESPVVAWAPTLDFQAKQMRVPSLVRRAVLALLASGTARPITGLATPIDFDTLDFVQRAAELTIPILLMHSEDDGYVPITASRALALARPDLVTFHAWSVARHAKLWNYDTARFEREVADWLAVLPPRLQRA